MPDTPINVQVHRLQDSMLTAHDGKDYGPFNAVIFYDLVPARDGNKREQLTFARLPTSINFTGRVLNGNPDYLLIIGDPLNKTHPLVTHNANGLEGLICDPHTPKTLRELVADKTSEEGFGYRVGGKPRQIRYDSSSKTYYFKENKRRVYITEDILRQADQEYSEERERWISEEKEAVGVDRIIPCLARVQDMEFLKGLRAQLQTDGIKIEDPHTDTSYAKRQYTGLLAVPEKHLAAILLRS